MTATLLACLVAAATSWAALPPFAGDLAADRVRAGELLVLDLDGDGLFLSDRYTPVRFDLDGDGAPETTSWTAAGRSEGFLWLDVDGDGKVGGATELVGSALRLPGHEPLADAFAALAELDRPARGGNGDGRLTAADRAWNELRVWVDRDHDGVAGPGETSSLTAWAIVELPTRGEEKRRVDGGLNLHRAEAPLDRDLGKPGGAPRHIRIRGTISAVSFDVLGPG